MFYANGWCQCLQNVLRIKWSNALRWRDPVSLWRRPLSVLFLSAAVQIWLWPTQITKKRHGGKTHNTSRCDALHIKYTLVHYPHSHTHSNLCIVWHTLLSCHPFTDPHSEWIKTQKKVPLRKWFTLKVLTWPITSCCVKNRINAYGHSSDSLSDGAKRSAFYTPFCIYCNMSTNEGGNHIFSRKTGFCHQPWVKTKFALLDLTLWCHRINISAQNNSNMENTNVRRSKQIFRYFFLFFL